MTQTTFKADDSRSSESIAVPLGIVRLVRSSFRRFGLRKLLDGFKEDGVPLGLVIENLCITCLQQGSSMNDWDDFVNRSDVRRSYYCGTYDIRRWTLQRGVERLGVYLEEIVLHLGSVLRGLYPDDPTHAYVDGSHVRRYGRKGASVAYGEGGGTIQLQNQFMVASMVSRNIPVSIEDYPGNLNDPPQYSDFIPQLMFLLKQGSLVIMDNGGAAAKTLDEITGACNQYLTRVRINASDERIIREERDRLVYVGMGTACIMHTFASSGRTTYLYFSVDSFAATMARAEKALAAKEIERRRAQGILTCNDALKVIKLPKSPFYEVEIKEAKLVMLDDPWVELDPKKELKDAMPTRGGWFKLECSFPMDPRLALVVYRHRVDVEHLISSLKSVVNVSPLRVWGEDSTRGRFVLGLIMQFVLAVFIDDLEPERTVKRIDGKPVEVSVRPRSSTVVKELRRYTGVVTPYGWGGFKVDELRDPGVSDDIARVLAMYDSEPPVRLPKVQEWISLPPAQWKERSKNCRDLAMSIAQYFAETKFPEFMDGRRHWKTGEDGPESIYAERICMETDSPGASGLIGRRSYYGPRYEGRSKKRSTAQ